MDVLFFQPQPVPIRPLACAACPSLIRFPLPGPDRVFSGKPRRIRRLRFQPLQQRYLLAGDMGHNFVEAEDVDLDGDVAVDDAVQLLTRIAQQQNQASIGGSVSSPDHTTMLLDVDDNGSLTTGDVLRVINRLAGPDPNIEALDDGIRDLAAAILTESLPEGMRLGTAIGWLTNIENRFEIPSENQGAFNRLDQDQNGRLTENEVDQALWSFFSPSDTDASNSVTHDEIKQARPAETNVQIPTDLADAAFDHLDIDENDALSEDEVSQRAWQHLSAADANQNSFVTLDEIRQARETNEHQVLRPEMQPAFNLLDINDDGQLSETEVTEGLWFLLMRADSDGDQFVTAKELQAYRQLNEQNVRLTAPNEAFGLLDLNSDGQLTSNEVSSEVLTILLRSDTNGDDRVTIDELAAARVANEVGVRGPNPAATFDTLDVNTNDAIDEHEVTAETWVKLQHADANTDSLISESELSAARQADESAVDGDSAQLSEAAFARLDLNEDQLLSEAEVSAATWTRLISLDADGDDDVTFAEIATARLAAARGPITLAFGINGGSPSLATEEITDLVDSLVTIDVYAIQRGDETRISDSGIISFGVDITHNTEFLDATDAKVSAEFGSFPLADVSTAGLIQLSGVSSGLTTPVTSGGEAFLLLGSFTVELTAVGTTTFSFVDPNPNPSVVDNALGDAASTDLDPIIFRDDAEPKTITLRVNSVDTA